MASSLGAPLVAQQTVTSARPLEVSTASPSARPAAAPQAEPSTSPGAPGVRPSLALVDRLPLEAVRPSPFAAAVATANPAGSIPFVEKNGFVFDGSVLFARDRPPSSRDIRQGSVGNCWLLATMSAVVDSNPATIRNAIRFDPATGNYEVKLKEEAWGRTSEVKVTVTQDDLKYVFVHRGMMAMSPFTVSTVDGIRVTGPIWPVVMEAAAAKYFVRGDSNKGIQDGLRLLNGDKQGPLSIWTAYRVFTGKPPFELSFTRLPFVNNQPSQILRVYNGAKSALAQRRPVVLTTAPESAGWFQSALQDGIADRHAFQVVGVKQVGGQHIVVLKNPWGHNRDVNEGRDTSSSIIEVSLEQLWASNSLGSICIGDR
jgi:Calpain family cysteine protease